VADEHLDHALEEEFQGKGAIIHALKVKDAHFRGLMERNHALWKEIQKIQNGIEAADDARHETLEKQRLVVLDEIAKMVAKASL